MVRLNHTDGEMDTPASKIPRQTLAAMKPWWFCIVDMHVVMIPNDMAKNGTGKQRVNRVADPVDGYLILTPYLRPKDLAQYVGRS